VAILVTTNTGVCGQTVVMTLALKRYATPYFGVA
jgi:hypothetical protein